MRVLVLTNMYPTPAEPWFGSFVRDQVDDLQALGLDIDVLPFDGRTDRKEYVRAAAELRRRISGARFDLVHAHYGLTGAVALSQRKLPTVTTFHGSDCGDPLYPRWHARVSRLVARRTTPIFVSRPAAENLGMLDAHVIPCACDTALLEPICRAEARRALGWREDRRYVLLPGNPNETRKNAMLFDKTIQVLRRDVRDLEPVALCGFQRKDVPLVFNAVNVTLMTSHFEGSPVALRESLACQTPVVSVAVGDSEEVLAGLPGCVVAPRDPVALATGVRRALEAGRPAMLRARAQAYSRSAVAHRVRAVYDEALAV